MKLMTVVLLGMFAVACGGGGGSEVTLDAQQKESVKQSSTNTVQAAADLKVLKSSKTDEAAFNKLGQAYGYASQLWSTKMQAEGGYGAYGLAPVEEFLGALDESCITTSGDTTTYNCNYGGGTMTGSITVSGDTITFADLSMTSAGYSYTFNGSVTVTDTMIDGSFTFFTDYQGMKYNVEISYNSITLDASGCPVGGSLVVDVDVDMSGYQGDTGGYDLSGAYDFPSVEVVFGPACGDVAMF